MKALATLFILLLLAACCRGSDLSEDGPHLEVASISGNLEIDRPSVIAVELHNNATYSATYDAGESDTGSDALDVKRSTANARAVEAELSSQDDSIDVLSGPQVLGTLAPGMNRSVRFTALAKGAQKGVYPLQLDLRFSRLVQVSTTGDESVPDVLFSYEEERLELPIQVDVVQGPKIETEEIKGNAALGKESEIEIILVNRGDESAVDLQMRPEARPPFDQAQAPEEKLQIEPDGRATIKLQVRLDENLATGDFPLPCKISYKNGNDGNMRSEDMAVMIHVQNDSFPGWLAMPAAGLLLLAGGIWGGRMLLGQKKRKARNFRR
jgi:hypothetical protein